jgi:hypothetical protein
MPEGRPVIERMQEIIHRWVKESDQRAIFLNCYQLMTQNMLKELEAGEFKDPGWVEQLLNQFADYYFNALDAYENKSPKTPIVWQQAHDAARLPNTMVLQNLLIGINAHINYDLVMALVDVLEPEWAKLPEIHRQQRFADHCHVNDVIGWTIDDVQDNVIERLAPAMDIVDILLGPIDEWMASTLITHWRDEVWDNAINYIKTPEPNAREELRQHIELVTLERGAAILFNPDLTNKPDLV